MQTLTVPASLHALAPISQFIGEATTQAGLDEHSAWQVQLAVDEAATNIIQHSYVPGTPGDIELSWVIEHGTLIIRLRDRGRRFNPGTIPPPDITSPLEERQAGGLGLFLMNQLMDNVQFEFDDVHGNLLTMVKQLAAKPLDIEIMRLNGRLDAASTDDVLRTAREAIHAGARRVLVDMADVTFMSSSGLRTLLLIRRELLAQNGELRLCELRPQVYDVFALTGFTQIFAIHSAHDEALAAFNQRKV